MGDFAEARRRLISKIEACEDIHNQMLSTYLPQRGIPRENYCRLNVEVGVGEFGMNEWNRVSDISTNTRRYLAKTEVQKLVYDTAVKIARIERGKRRLDNHVKDRNSFVEERLDLPQPSHPMVAELPADEGLVHSPQAPKYSSVAPPQPAGYPYQSQVGDDDKILVTPTAEQHLSTQAPSLPPRTSNELPYRPANQPSPASQSPHPSPTYPPTSDYGRTEAPPLPPKTPISSNYGSTGQVPQVHPRRNGNMIPPYPEADGPPPLVNKLRKPEYSAR